MPVRRFVTNLLAGNMTGTHLFTYGVSETITDEQLADAQEVADALYCRVVGLVDWSRILLEALGRCMCKDHETQDGPCASCVHEALLNTDPREEAADVEESRIEDWSKAVANCVTYRRKK